VTHIVPSLPPYLPPLPPGLLSEFGVEEESTIQLLMDINVRRGGREGGGEGES
jgi:hypothetical protein